MKVTTRIQTDKRGRGFTVVELILVLVVLGISASVLFKVYQSMTLYSMTMVRARKEADGICRALDFFFQSKSREIVTSGISATELNDYLRNFFNITQVTCSGGAPNDVLCTIKLQPKSGIVADSVRFTVNVNASPKRAGATFKITAECKDDLGNWSSNCYDNPRICSSGVLGRNPGMLRKYLIYNYDGKLNQKTITEWWSSDDLYR